MLGMLAYAGGMIPPISYHIDIPIITFIIEMNCIKDYQNGRS